MTENDNKSIVKRSYTKKEKYEKEQMEIVERLNEILGLSETNKFILEDLKMDKEKQGKIIGLEEDVKKYFACRGWACFNKEVDNKWLSLLRSIYKSSGYELSYKQKTKAGEKFTEYIVIKNL